MKELERELKEEARLRREGAKQKKIEKLRRKAENTLKSEFRSVGWRNVVSLATNTIPSHVLGRLALPGHQEDADYQEDEQEAAPWVLYHLSLRCHCC